MRPGRRIARCCGTRPKRRRGGSTAGSRESGRVALPHELNHGQRVALAKDFASVIVERYGVAADVAVHAPSRSGDQRNWHAHILCTTRRIGNKGFGAKASWSGRTRTWRRRPAILELADRELRMAWEERTNEALAAAGHEVRVDHRSYAEQGVGLEAARDGACGAVACRGPGCAIGDGAHPSRRAAGPGAVGTQRRGDRRPAGAAAGSCDGASFGVHASGRSARPASVRQRGLGSVRADAECGDGERNPRVPGRGRADGRHGPRGRAGVDDEGSRHARGGDAGSAERLATARDGGLSARAIAKGIASIEKGKGRDGGQTIHLSDEQRTAVRTLGGEGQLAILRGVAGTGKTTALSAYRVAAQREGVRVIGGALAGKAARELEGGSASRAARWRVGSGPGRPGSIGWARATCSSWTRPAWSGRRRWHG